MDLNTVSPGVTPCDAPNLDSDAYDHTLDSRYADWLNNEKQVGGGFFVSHLYVRMAGNDFHAGMLLGQIAYWFGLGENGQVRARITRDGRTWIAKTRDAWKDEIYLSKRQAIRALGILRDLGLIETMIAKFGLDPTTHIRIVWSKFLNERERVSKELADNASAKKAPKPLEPSVRLETRRRNDSQRDEPKPDTTGIAHEQNASQEALALEGTDRRSSNSLSGHQQTRDSDGRRSSQEVTNPPSAGESSGTENLKRQGQKPAPRAGKRGSDTSSASSVKAVVVKDTDLSPAARETLAAALRRQTELKGAANIPHTRRRLLALRGADEPAWIALLEHSTLKARDCVAGFAETHAKRPAGAGSSLADDAAAKKRSLARGGSYGQRGAFVEDGAPQDPSDPKRAARLARRLARHELRASAERNNPDDSYEQFGARIERGTRPTPKGPSRDLRRSGRGVLYELLPGERTDDKFADYYGIHDDHDIPCGIGQRDVVHARLAADPERVARAARRHDDYEWLFDSAASETESKA